MLLLWLGSETVARYQYPCCIDWYLPHIVFDFPICLFSFSAALASGKDQFCHLMKVGKAQEESSFYQPEVCFVTRSRSLGACVKCTLFLWWEWSGQLSGRWRALTLILLLVPPHHHQCVQSNPWAPIPPLCKLSFILLKWLLLLRWVEWNGAPSQSCTNVLVYPEGLVSVYIWCHDLVMCLQSIFDELGVAKLAASGVCACVRFCSRFFKAFLCVLRFS